MVKSVTSLPGKPLTFSTVASGLEVSEGQESATEETKEPVDLTAEESVSTSKLNLREKIRVRERQNLNRAGKELVALRLVPESMKFAETAEASRTFTQGEAGMKAVVIARDRGEANQFSFKVMQVNERGETQEVFQSGSLEELQKQSQQNQFNLNLQGSLLETTI